MTSPKSSAGLFNLSDEGPIVYFRIRGDHLAHPFRTTVSFRRSDFFDPDASSILAANHLELLFSQPAIALMARSTHFQDAARMYATTAITADPTLVSLVQPTAPDTPLDLSTIRLLLLALTTTGPQIHPSVTFDVNVGRFTPSAIFSRRPALSEPLHAAPATATAPATTYSNLNTVFPSGFVLTTPTGIQTLRAASAPFPGICPSVANTFATSLCMDHLLVSNPALPLLVDPICCICLQCLFRSLPGEGNGAYACTQCLQQPSLAIGSNALLPLKMERHSTCIATDTLLACNTPFVPECNCNLTPTSMSHDAALSPCPATLFPGIVAPIATLASHSPMCLLPSGTVLNGCPLLLDLLVAHLCCLCMLGLTPGEGIGAPPFAASFGPHSVLFGADSVLQCIMGQHSMHHCVPLCQSTTPVGDPTMATLTFTALPPEPIDSFSSPMDVVMDQIYLAQLALVDSFAKLAFRHLFDWAYKDLALGGSKNFRTYPAALVQRLWLDSFAKLAFRHLVDWAYKDLALGSSETFRHIPSPAANSSQSVWLPAFSSDVPCLPVAFQHVFSIAVFSLGEGEYIPDDAPTTNHDVQMAQAVNVLLTSHFCLYCKVAGCNTTVCCMFQELLADPQLLEHLWQMILAVQTQLAHLAQYPCHFKEQVPLVEKGAGDPFASFRIFGRPAVS